MEAAECGAAALSIILAYYGRHVSLEKMRVECGVSRDGSNAVNILKAARRYGLVALGARVDELDTLYEVKLPCILFWEFNHFVVLEGIRGKKFYINDPATGPRVVDRNTFNRAFTGVVLTFEPTEDFQKGGKAFSVRKALQRRLHGSNTALFYVILASLALVIPGIVIPGFSKIFIDDILIRNTQNWFMPLIVGMVITAGLRGLLTWLQNYYLMRMQIKLTLTASANFLWHVLFLPITFFQQRFAGDVQERVAANNRVADLLSGELSISVVSLISMVFFAVVMSLLSWPLTLIAILVAFVNFILLYSVARRIADINRRFLQERGKLTGFEMNGLQAIESLKAMGAEDDFFIRWAGYHTKTINSQQRIMLYNQLLLILPRLLSGLTTVTILGLGSWQIMQGYLTVGTLVAFQSLVISFNAPLGALLGLGNQIQQIRGDLARLDDVLQHPKDIRISQIYKTPMKIKHVPPEIKFHHVQFGYSLLNSPLLSDFNWQINAGSRVALVGKTGSGKSTVAKILCGLYQPWKGEILINDKSLSQISPQSLANILSFVDQDILLFEGTVEDNLTLWEKKYSHENIQRALQDACLEDVINERGGIGSWVAERGSNFSGGQQQRLEIARALVNNPAILILDEATAALDPVIEKRIYDHLKQRACTLFIIAHRLSAIRECDEIVVIDNGQIVQQGKHEELLQQKGPYVELISFE